jgi:hypothetical protein
MAIWLLFTPFGYSSNRVDFIGYNAGKIWMSDERKYAILKKMAVQKI